MKAGKEHRVALSDAAMDVLRRVRPVDAAPDAWLFAVMRGKKPGVMMMTNFLNRRMGRADITVHGMRSTFKVWSLEATDYPDAVSEAALAHTGGNAVRRAYARTDLFEKRRALMQDWGQFCGEIPALRVAAR